MPITTERDQALEAVNICEESLRGLLDKPGALDAPDAQQAARNSLTVYRRACATVGVPIPPARTGAALREQIEHAIGYVRSPADPPEPRPLAAPTHGRNSYDSVFGRTSGEPGTAEYPTLGHYLRAVARGEVRASQSEMIADEGGAAVPPVFAKPILTTMLGSSIVMSRATIYDIPGPELVIPTIDNFDHSQNLYGGFEGDWLAERQAGSYEKAKFAQVRYHARKFMVLARASNEILEDVTALQALLNTVLTDVARFKADLAFLRGDGSDRPLGILNAASRVVVPAEQGQTGGIIAENVANMQARLYSDCWPNAIWLAHPSTLPQLKLLTLAVGTGGTHLPMFTVGADGNARLDGRTLLFSEKMSELGDEGDLVLVDLSKYCIAMRKQIMIESSNSADDNFIRDMRSFRLRLRLDGQPLWRSAVTPAFGSDTLSWCVTLATRA